MSNDFPIIDPTAPRAHGSGDTPAVASVYTHPIRRATEPVHVSRCKVPKKTLSVLGGLVLVASIATAVILHKPDPASMSCGDVAEKAIDASADDLPATQLDSVSNTEIVEDHREGFTTPASGTAIVMTCVGDATWADGSETLVLMTLNVDARSEIHVDSEPTMMSQVGSKVDQKTTGQDAVALADLIEKSSAGTAPADIIAVSNLISATKFTFNEGNLLYTYTRPGQGSYEFCVVNIESQAWSFYRSASGEVAGSGTKGLGCMASAAPETPPAA